MRKAIFIALSLFVTILIVSLFLYFSFGRQTGKQQRLVIPTPLPNRVPTLPATNSIDPIVKYDLVQTLPFSSPNYNIEYLATSDTFIVTIKEPPLETNKSAALDWFMQNGVDPKKLRIRYNIYRWVE